VAVMVVLDTNHLLLALQLIMLAVQAAHFKVSVAQVVQTVLAI
jgi:hypothetical protein